MRSKPEPEWAVDTSDGKSSVTEGKGAILVDGTPQAPQGVKVTIDTEVGYDEANAFGRGPK